jgi:hypothetical protein
MIHITESTADAIDQAIDRTEHAVHGGWDVTPSGDVVCAWDGDLILKVSEVA